MYALEAWGQGIAPSGSSLRLHLRASEQQEEQGLECALGAWDQGTAQPLTVHVPVCSTGLDEGRVAEFAFELEASPDTGQHGDQA